MPAGLGHHKARAQSGVATRPEGILSSLRENTCAIARLVAEEPKLNGGLDVATANNGAGVDLKFEIVVIPVSDVERAKNFYTKLGWRLDADFDSGKDFRVIQFTP